MNGYKDTGFNDRLKTAQSARKAALEKFRAQPAPDDPAVLARAVERAAINAARDARAAERKAEREAEAIREAAEAEARKVAEAAQAIQSAADKEALLVAQKAARDARYAARKNRK